LTPVINTISQLKKWLKFNKNKKKIIIHFDTGMCRLGIQEDKVKEVIKLKKNLDQYKEVIIMSHLACSGDKKNKYNEIQRLRFEKIKKSLPGYKYSLAASGGIFLGKRYHYDLVRPGINLYGGNKNFNKKIMHVVSLRSPIIQINNLKKGETVGYSRTFKAKKNTVTATIPLGYADGIGIRLSNKGYVHFNGKKLPMIGRVSMDLIIIDITKLQHKIKEGDFVNIYNNKFTIDNFANLTGTIPYRIITCISKRYLRNYKN
jgi:alanine racemase